MTTMLANVFHGVNDISVESVPKPSIDVRDCHGRRARFARRCG